MPVFPLFLPRAGRSCKTLPASPSLFAGNPTLRPFPSRFLILRVLWPGGDWRSQEDPPRAQRPRKRGGNRGDAGASTVPTVANTLQGATSLSIKSTCPQANVTSLAGRVKGLVPKGNWNLLHDLNTEGSLRDSVPRTGPARASGAGVVPCRGHFPVGELCWTLGAGGLVSTALQGLPL